MRQHEFIFAGIVKERCIGATENHVMPNETCHDVYRTWAALTEAARTDEKAWLFLITFAPWATRLLDEPRKH